MFTSRFIKLVHKYCSTILLWYSHAFVHGVLKCTQQNTVCFPAKTIVTYPHRWLLYVATHSSRAHTAVIHPWSSCTPDIPWSTSPTRPEYGTLVGGTDPEPQPWFFSSTQTSGLPCFSAQPWYTAQQSKPAMGLALAVIIYVGHTWSIPWSWSVGLIMAIEMLLISLNEPWFYMASLSTVLLNIVSAWLLLGE